MFCIQANYERNAVEEMKAAEASGRFEFLPLGAHVPNDGVTGIAHFK